MRRLVILFWSLLFVISTVGAQKSSFNGCAFPSKGKARFFMIFTEVLNDPYDNMAVPAWNKGEMPNMNYIQSTIKDIEQYYKEASFGLLDIEVDYCPKLIQVKYRSGDKEHASEVLGKLEELYGDSGFITPKGLKFPEDFDQWNIGDAYTKKILEPDGCVDFIAVFFRYNSAMTRDLINAYGGHTRNGEQLPVFTAKGANRIAFMAVPPHSMSFLLRHEFGHSLLGGNEYHSGVQGAGPSTYIHNFSGYGLLSSTTCSNHFCNAWDRRRLGWKRADKKYFIGALNEGGRMEEDADLVYDRSVSRKRFRLRDFTTYGDAVRIKLPYIDSKSRPQWIWIENHQPKPGTIEYKSFYYDEQHKPVPKGMYVCYQIGNESFVETGNSRTNYYTPEISLGNYDLTKIVANGSAYDFYVDDSLSNPFTGYDFISNPGYDRNGNGLIAKGEQISAARIFVNGKEIPKSDCHFAQYVSMGSKYDAFTKGQKLCISSNPAPVPRLTFCDEETASDNNRKIYLNGLSIEMKEQYDNGDILVEISCADRRIRNDIRWCGDIVLNEFLAFSNKSTLLLDQGLSAVRRKNPILFRGKKVFADPTFFTFNSGSQLSLLEGSRVVVRNNSTLLVNENAMLSVGRGKVVVESGGTLKIKSDGSLRLSSNGEVCIRKGSFICVEDGAKINLLVDACLVVEDDACYGVNPAIPALQGSTFAKSAEEIKFQGKGQILRYTQELYLQDEELAEKKKYVVGKARIGGSTAGKSYKILGTGHLIIEADDEITISDGFEVESGGQVEFQKGI